MDGSLSYQTDIQDRPSAPADIIAAPTGPYDPWQAEMARLLGDWRAFDDEMMRIYWQSFDWWGDLWREARSDRLFGKTWGWRR